MSRHTVEKRPRHKEMVEPLFDVAVDYSTSQLFVVVTLKFAYLSQYWRPTKVIRGCVSQPIPFLNSKMQTGNKEAESLASGS